MSEKRELAAWQVILAALAVSLAVALASPVILKYLDHVMYETDRQWVEEVCSVMAAALGDAYVNRPSGEAAGDGWISVAVLDNDKKADEEDERYRSFDHEVLKNLEEDEGFKVESRLQTEGADELYYRITEDYGKVEVKATGKGEGSLPEGICLEAEAVVKRE